MTAVEGENIDLEESQPPSEEPSTQSMGALAGKASSSAVWTILGQGGGQAVRLVSNLIVTRLLLTEYFGLMALVQVFLIGLQLFSDIGIGPALIQNKREDPTFVNTVWTMQVMRGLALCLIAMPLAGPFAAFYDQPILASLIRVAALTAGIQGFTSTAVFTETRHLHLKRPVLVQFGAQLSGAVVMVVWAWLTRSIWSLVAAGIVGSVVTVVLSHVWLPGIRNRFRFDRKAARSLFAFGSWIFLSTVAFFASEQLDRIIFGKITTMATLGVYSIAVMLAAAPTYALLKLQTSVLFPLYSRVRHSSSNLAEVFATARWPLLVFGGWATAGLVGGGPTILRLLYDSRYWEAGWMLQILASGIWFGLILGGTAGSVILAVGRSEWTAAISFSKVVAMLGSVPLGYWLAGFPGAVAGLAVSELVRYGVAELGAVKLGFDARKEDLMFTIRIAISALTGWLSVQWLGQLGIENVVLHALLLFVVVTAFWARSLGVLLGRVRRKEGLFLQEDPPQPEVA